MSWVPAEPARSQGGEKPSLLLGETTSSAGQETVVLCCMVSAQSCLPRASWRVGELGLRCSECLGAPDEEQPCGLKETKFSELAGKEAGMAGFLSFTLTSF